MLAAAASAFEVLAEASAAAAASVEASVAEVLAAAYCMASDLRHSDNTSDNLAVEAASHLVVASAAAVRA